MAYFRFESPSRLSPTGVISSNVILTDIRCLEEVIQRSKQAYQISVNAVVEDTIDT